MTYRVFYWLQKAKKSVPGDKARRMELADVHSDIFAKLERDGDFFGLVDAKDTTLQARYDQKEEIYWFEIPDAKKQGSYGTALRFDDAVELMKSLKPIFRVKDFPTFRFVAWSDDELAEPPKKKKAAKKKKKR